LESGIVDGGGKASDEDKEDSTLTSMANVASSYRKQGRRTEAEKLEMQAMDTRKAVSI
jgi:hypothetical protein